MNIDKILCDYFSKMPGLISLFLFGSFAKNQATATSDIDVAAYYLHDHAPTYEQCMAIQQDLSDLIHKDVDFICLNRASPIIAMQVYKEGKELLITNQKEHGKYLIQLFNQYAELKQLRKPMEEALLKRKIQ